MVNHEAELVVTAPVRVDLSVNWPDCDPYRQEFGGLILNAAIDNRVSTSVGGGTFELSMGDVPPNSGLGTSAAIRTTLMMASNPGLATGRTLEENINAIYTFENEVLGQRAGKQDQAAALAGGVNLWEFTAEGAINRTPADPGKIADLGSRLAVVYTGQKHESGDLHELVFTPDNYRRIIPIIHHMNDVARSMFRHIDDPRAMAELMDEARQLHKAPYEGIETDIMRSISASLAGPYLSWKAAGTGGGGCMLFYTDSKEDLKLKFEAEQAAGNLPAGARWIPCVLAHAGVTIERT
jgi:D-glycero-alpha-D-manno-heptose-7-phosphate kinase